MRKHFLRVVVAALPVLLGIVIGFAWSQATLEPSARAAAAACKPSEAKVQRFGSVIGLKPEMKDEYIRLHANAWPNVLEQIRKSNIKNYSIYMAELEGKLYLFSYFEYVGSDFEGDMAKMAEDAETRRWWKVTDPCQTRLAGTPDGQQWLSIREVFHTD